MTLLSLLALVLLGAFSISLAAVEACYFQVKRRRLSHLAVQNARAELANRYLEDPQRLLMPVHLGTYTAHVAMTAVLASLLLGVMGRWAILTAFVVMMGYLFAFRLALPYALVRRNPERALLLILPIADRYLRLVEPIVALLRVHPRHEAHSAGGDAAPKSTPEVPPPPVGQADEVRLVVAVERFADTLVRDVMTPRPDVVAVPAKASVSEARRLLGETKFSRLPVCSENLDDIVGFVSVRDLLQPDGDQGQLVSGLMRPVHMVPETKRISELLKELQAQRTTLAVVIDEYGGTAGLVTMEDIVEELVGEIKDEYDTETEPMVVESDGALLLSARCNLDLVEQAVETALHEGEGARTVGGLVAEVFGRIPRAGDRIDFRGFSLEIVDADRRRVSRVRVRRLPREAEA